MFLSYGVIMYQSLLFLPILSSIPQLSILEVDYHYVREKVLHRDLKIRFVSGTDNMVDIFTKPLPAPPFLSFHSKLLVDSSPYRLWGDVEDEAQAQRNGGSGSTQVQQRMHHLRL